MGKKFEIFPKGHGSFIQADWDTTTSFVKDTPAQTAKRLDEQTVRLCKGPQLTVSVEAAKELIKHGVIESTWEIERTIRKADSIKAYYANALRRSSIRGSIYHRKPTPRTKKKKRVQRHYPLYYKPPRGRSDIVMIDDYAEMNNP